MGFQVWAFFPALLAALALAACATQEPPARAPFRPRAALPPSLPPAPSFAPAGPSPRSDPFAGLAGWRDDDHVAAFEAFKAACPWARNPGAAPACAAAGAAGRLSEAQARAFFENRFRPEPVPGAGLLTAYFSPVYEARTAPGGDFTAPVRPRPADLPPADRAAASQIPYADRASIEARPAAGALAWMRPEELFFLQIQGSGTLVFPGRARARAIFDGSNGAPFRGIAAPMREQGLLADTDTSGEALRAWLAAHRGWKAQAIMRLDPRYVFFRLAPDDGAAPAGAAGARLIAGRSVAVDPARHALGELLWIDAASPALAGAFPTYRRLTVALDVGGAIKGEARADLYLGGGPSAGLEAGRVRHALRLWRLVPVG
ncbi:MAG: MltA domain-containing protein [Pseudomonadota bacterium]